MKKPLAIVFSDLHINNWNKHNLENSRTLNHLRVLFDIKDKCLEYKCPAIFCGDLFHKPENMPQELLQLVQEKFFELDSIPGFTCYAISGNHDINVLNTLENPSNSWVSIFAKYHPWLKCIDFQKVRLGKYTLLGIPYIDGNQGLNLYLSNYIKDNSHNKTILLLHTNYPGAKDTDDRVVDVDNNLSLQVLSLFDLVLCGHIHKPQKLSNNTYMIGAPLQQRRTDKNCDLGYWELYSDLSLKFIPLENYPKFIDVESEDQIQFDGNYYTVVPPEIISDNDEEDNTGRILSKRKLISQYLKDNGLSKDRKRRKLLFNILKEAQNED